MAETIPFRADVGRSAATVRTITIDDLKEALRRGLGDLDARSTRMFVYLIYPVLGVLLIWMAMRRDVIPLIFPLVSGFALVGPFFAVGLYQISRCRARGEEISVRSAFNIFRCPDKSALFSMGLILAALFFAWLVVALILYELTLGAQAPHTVGAFVIALVGTRAGWTLIIAGNVAGFLFALVALAISAISLPMILDRHVGAGTAILTSVDAIVKNPVPMAVWGLIVGVSLFVGSLPALGGCAVVFPILGHET